MNVEGGVLFNNKIIDAVFIAWFIAQGYKVFVALIEQKRIDFRKFVSTGGMPSSHTSSVMALVTSVGITEGINSINFAIALVFAVVVMYDAAGVRRSAGQQAKVLNRIVADMVEKDGKKFLEKDLKELLGHTPVEVLVGAAVGMGVAYLVFL